MVQQQSNEAGISTGDVAWYRNNPREGGLFNRGCNLLQKQSLGRGHVLQGVYGMAEKQSLGVQHVYRDCSLVQEQSLGGGGACPAGV